MQNVVEKCLYLFFITIFFMNVSVVFAAPQEISAEGEYRLGDTDTRDKAKKAALADAKRKIIEQAGVFVESYTEVNNFKVTQDQIKSVASAMIKVKSEKVDFYENGTLCKAFITATVDTDNIGKYLIDIPNTQQKQQHTKINGYEEFNGHYYKLFNEGMIWQEANRRCEVMGGHLVTITSDSEQAIIQKLVLLKGTKNSYWIGGYKGSTGNWEWITGESFSYAHWAFRQPDTDGGNANALMMTQRCITGRLPHFLELQAIRGIMRIQ